MSEHVHNFIVWGTDVTKQTEIKAALTIVDVCFVFSTENKPSQKPRGICFMSKKQ